MRTIIITPHPHFVDVETNPERPRYLPKVIQPVAALPVAFSLTAPYASVASQALHRTTSTQYFGLVFSTLSNWVLPFKSKI